MLLDDAILRSCSARSGKRSIGPRSPVPRGISGVGPASSVRQLARVAETTSATPRAWSKRTSTSGTTKRLSGKPRPASGSGTVGSSFATASYPR